MSRRVLPAAVIVLVALAGCGGSSAPRGSGTSSGGSGTSSAVSSSTPPSTTSSSAVSGGAASTRTAPPSRPPQQVQRSVRLYFLGRDVTLVPVARTVSVRDGAVAAAAVTAVLAGPSAAERADGIGSAVPAGTALRGVVIAAGIADVDLTSAFTTGGGTASMTGRVGQIVYTLTQFPTVRGVTFRVDGKPLRVLGGEGLILDRPMTRQALTGLLPPIFIDSPARGETVTSPVSVRGLANVFEGQFQVEVRDAYGAVLARRPALGAMGHFGDVAVTLPYAVRETQRGTVVGYDRSAKDGSVIDVFAVPVTLRAPTALPDGTYEARIPRIDPQGLVATIDVVQLFTGPDAARAAGQDRAPEVPPPNDHWIRDLSHEVHQVVLSPDVTVTVNTLAAGTTGSAVRDVERQLSWLAGVPGLSGALFSVTLRQGRVVRIAEHYLP